MYIIEPTTLKYIPNNTFLNLTDLISILQKDNKKVGVYPVSENSWIDIGQWEKYKDAVEKFKL